MPVVRTYGPNQVEQRPKARAYRTNAPSAESFGAGLARQGTQIATSILTETIQRERSRANEIAVLDAETQRDSALNDLLRNPQSGAFTVKGMDVFGVPTRVTEAYDKTVADLTANLKNDEQRFAFARSSTARRQAMQGQLSEYVLRESQQLDADTTKAALENATSAAIASADNPGHVAQELARGLEVLDGWGKRNGASPEMVENQRLAFTTQVHTGVIDRYLEGGKDAAAKAYYEETRGQISGEAQTRIEKALEEGTLRGQAQRETDKILAAGGTLTEQREKARAIEDPELRDAVMARIEHEAQFRAAQAREADEALMRSVYDIVDRTRNVDAIPRAIWSQLSGSDRSALRSYADRLATGKGVETDDETFYTLLTLSSTDPDAFMETNLLRYKNRLSPGILRNFMEKQASMRTGDSKRAAGIFATESETNRIVDAALMGFGLDPTPAAPGSKGYDKKAVEQITAFRRSVREAIERREAVGDKLTPGDIQSIVDTLSATVGQRVVKEGWFSNETAPLYAFELPHPKVSNVADVPAGERAKIEAALTKAGMPVTAPNILLLFNAQLEKIRGAK